MSAGGDITTIEVSDELIGYKALLIKMKEYHLSEIQKLNTEIINIEMGIIEVYNDQKTERSKA